jgi:hypothetical protein
VNRRAFPVLLPLLLPLCIWGALSWATVTSAWRLRGWGDFVPLYTSTKLVGTPDLYSPEAIERVELAVHRGSAPALLFTRLPFVAVLLWPLGQAPYAAAYWIWTAMRVLAVGGFIWAWPHTSRLRTAIGCCFFLPVTMALTGGQDTPFLMLWIALAERMHRRRPVAAGLLLSLCLAKFHLFLLLPVYLWMHRRRLVAGFAAGCAILMAMSFLAQGPAWPFRYLDLLRLTRINPWTVGMPNIHGLQLSPPVEAAVCLLVALAAVAGIVLLEDTLALAAALVAGVLLSYHAYLPDAVLALPALLAVWTRWRGRGRAASAVTPVDICDTGVSCVRSPWWCSSSQYRWPGRRLPPAKCSSTASNGG